MLFDINNPTYVASYSDAIKFPIPSEGSLWFPEQLPHFPYTLLEKTKYDIAFNIVKSFLGNEISLDVLGKIVDKVFTFDAPCIELNKNKNLFLCDLTCGPTQAFKDFGARLSAYITKELLGANGTIAVATSGDTGGAVVSACQDTNLKSLILYPFNRISEYQRNQISHSYYDLNIPIAIEGTFDDCQTSVKTILSRSNNIYSGNSVSILRLIAQVVYYFWIAKDMKSDFSVVVPSGNLGNATAAAMAKVMGAPIKSIVISGNENCQLTKDIILGKNKINNLRAKQTIASAMDVCMPSNLIRMQHLCNINPELADCLLVDIVPQEQIKSTIIDVYKKFKQVIDPHTAVGVYSANKLKLNDKVVILSTAAPIKFIDTMNNILPGVITPNTEVSNLNNDIIVRTSAFPKMINQANIIFTGMPGSGKSTCGALLATRLQMNFLDVDTLIEDDFGKSLQNIIQKYGKDWFKTIEKNACLDAIKNKNSVISPGGSANLIQEVFEASSESCLVIWINTPIETLLLRLGDLEKRGVVMEKNETFNDLFERRTINYKKNYDIQINNDNFTVLLKLLNLWYY